MRRRLAWAVLIAGALYFALQGGEYSTLDLLRQRGQKRALEARVDSLRRELDSLRAVAGAIERDSATQERIAREEFGMVRGDMEVLYRLADPADSAIARGKFDGREKRIPR